MRRIIINCLALLALVVAGSNTAWAQMGGGMGGMGGMGGRPGGGMSGPGGGAPSDSPPPAENSDKKADKAYKAGMKSLAKAKDQTAVAAAATNEDKKNAALEKVNDAYGRALDQFTEALVNNGDMYQAWNNVGYIHLRLGAYGESVDDYNHALKLKPDLLDAIEHRAEAYVAIDRLDEAKAAYMDLFNHDRQLADELMSVMQGWVTAHRTNANGMRAGDIDAFAKWVQERDGIAKQTASLTP